MASRTAYADDFYLWSQEQAALLRDLAHAGRHLPNALDIENIAEEIESVGRSELNKVRSLIERVLTHLLKIASLAEDAEPVRHWRSEVRHWLSELPRHFLASMRQTVDLDKIWRSSVRLASADLSDFGDRLLIVCETCPLDLDDLLDEAFEIDALVLKIRAVV
jgi:hypothetical protein